MEGNVFLGTKDGDFIIGSNESDIILGLEGDDTILGGNGIDVLLGNAGNDLLEGGNDLDLLFGGSGDDTLIGDKGDDIQFAGAGDDLMIWNDGDGSDTMRGEDGQDVVQVNGSVVDGDEFELRANGEIVEFERVNLGPFELNIDDVEAMEINGNGGDDRLLVGDLAGTDVATVTFNGGDGNDVLDASQSTQTIVANGGEGNDTLTAGSGNDILQGGNGDDVLNGGAGDDTLQGGNGNDVTDGGAGNDTADFSDIPFEIDADLEAGVANYKVNGVNVQDQLISIENLSGSQVDDTLKGDEQVNILQGNDGNDTLVGRQGDDIMEGGAGNDLLIWNNGDGSDRMEGGAGQDVVQVNGSIDQGDNFELRANGDRVDFKRVNLGFFQLDIDDVEAMEINGNGGEDSLLIESLVGTDLEKVVFNGGDGNDLLDASNTDIGVLANGGNGDDTLIGGSANDTLAGGNGNNEFTGGLGADTFVASFDGIDIIKDFNVGEGDMVQIQLELLDGSYGSADDVLNDLSYNSSTGTLSLGATEFATLENRPGVADVIPQIIEVV